MSFHKVIEHTHHYNKARLKKIALLKSEHMPQPVADWLGGIFYCLKYGLILRNLVFCRLTCLRWGFNFWQEDPLLHMSGIIQKHSRIPSLMRQSMIVIVTFLGDYLNCSHRQSHLPSWEVWEEMVGLTKRDKVKESTHIKAKDYFSKRKRMRTVYPVNWFLALTTPCISSVIAVGTIWSTTNKHHEAFFI